MSQTSPPSSLHCTRCNELLPPGYQPGLCPVCLMDMAMRPTQDDTLPVAPPQKPLTPEELAPHFPQFEILECIGRGGMGVVYKARQKTLHRLVALKLLAPEQKKDAAFAERFAHEARALAALNHPNIVTVYDFGETGGFFYLLMEFVDGVNLRQAMRGSHVSPEQALAIVPPICEALQYAHEHGIVHRDIKPENLLLDKAGRVKIADFGIAKMMGSEKAAVEQSQDASTAPRSTVVAGTPEYMAPEQRTASASADHRADIYSLGVVLYELLTGERPSGHLQMPWQENGTHTQLDEIVRRALAQDPAQRYQTVKELQQHLVTLSAAPPEVQVYPRENYQRWFSWLLRIGGVLCVCYGVFRLQKPELFRRHVVVPPGLNLSLLFFIAAWVLIVHARRLTRISYRQLIMPPRLPTEMAGMLLRLAGLWGTGQALAWLRDYWLQGSIVSLEFGLALLLFSLGLFRFEHACAPMAYAIPVWRPLPYADTPSRRWLSGHALFSALPLAFVLVVLCAAVALLCRRVSYESGVEWNATMSHGLTFWGCLAVITSALGWAAVNLIRGSKGRLFGLGLASASALALPLYLGFLILTYLIYSVVTNRSVSYITLPNGRVGEDLSRHPAMLAGAAITAGISCVACWLWLWKKLRSLPRPGVVASGSSRPQPRTAFATAGGVAFAALVLTMYSLMTHKPPPSPKIAEPAPPSLSPGQPTGSPPQPNLFGPPLTPYEPRFARHVERQLNLRLFIHGYSHTLRQGSLKLPPDRRMMTLRLPGLRDDESHHKLNGSLLLSRNENEVFVMSEKAMPAMRFTVSQRTPEALPLELVLPAPPAGTRCLGSLQMSYLIEPPAALHARLQASPETLTPEDITWLHEHHADFMVEVDADGGVALRFFEGSAVPVPHGLPADADWLDLDDRQLAKALVKAYASIPAEGGSTLVREQSPTILAFATRKNLGLIQNLGPSEPGARDARIRLTRLTYNPFR